MWTYSLVPPDPLLHLSSSSIRCVPEVARFPPLCNKVDIAGKLLHLRHHSPKRGLTTLVEPGLCHRQSTHTPHAHHGPTWARCWH